jgi:hypothetical protein
VESAVVFCIFDFHMIISDPANAYVHVSEAHTTHIWIDICVCI